MCVGVVTSSPHTLPPLPSPLPQTRTSLLQSVSAAAASVCSPSRTPSREKSLAPEDKNFGAGSRVIPDLMRRPTCKIGDRHSACCVGTKDACAKWLRIPCGYDSTWGCFPRATPTTKCDMQYCDNARTTSFNDTYRRDTPSKETVPLLDSLRWFSTIVRGFRPPVCIVVLIRASTLDRRSDGRIGPASIIHHYRLPSVFFVVTSSERRSLSLKTTMCCKPSAAFLQ